MHVGPWTGADILNFVLKWYGRSPSEWNDIFGSSVKPVEEEDDDDSDDEDDHDDGIAAVENKKEAGDDEGDGKQE